MGQDVGQAHVLLSGTLRTDRSARPYRVVRRGVDVMMDCRRRPPVSPGGYTLSSWRQRVLRSAYIRAARPHHVAVPISGCEAVVPTWPGGERAPSALQCGSEPFVDVLIELLAQRRTSQDAQEHSVPNQK